MGAGGFCCDCGTLQSFSDACIITRPQKHEELLEWLNCVRKEEKFNWSESVWSVKETSSFFLQPHISVNKNYAAYFSRRTKLTAG